MLIRNKPPETIPAGFRHLITTAAGLHWFVRYNGDGTKDYASYMDVQPLLDANGNAANQNNGWSTDKDKALRRAASVPIALITKWKIEEGWDYYNPDHWDKVRQKLNDRDYYKLRTADWTV